MPPPDNAGGSPRGNRVNRPATAALVLLLAALGGCGSEDSAPEASLPFRAAPDAGRAPRAAHFELKLIASGLVRPTHVSAAPGDEHGLWVLEQPGRLRRLAGDRRRTVLDISDQVKVGGEQGMLGVAFHPDFDRNRRLFLDYTNRNGDTRIVEYRLDRHHRARPSTRRELLRLAQPEENHNGGAILFGPDGRLYVGMGDGGGTFDPRRLAQNPRSLLGKVIAANVDRSGRPRWEIVLSGLRNPWRMWFDPAMTQLWIGDVGQDKVEEIDRVRLELDEPPKNLGWPAFEGNRKARPNALRGKGDLIGPTIVYRHSHGCSVTAGLIYRGSAIPNLSERYVFGDFCSGHLWTLRPAPAGRARDIRVETAKLPQLTHIGTDTHGELIFATAEGKILKATPTNDR
jgi:glucose/arabinose dehydrogenase